MKNKDTNKSKVANSKEYLSISDCLKMIGMTEVTANVFSFPSKKSSQTH